MFIANKQKAIMINVDSIEEIRAVPRNENSAYVRADITSGKGLDLGTYEIADDAFIAVDLLIAKMLTDRESSVICMPTQEEVTKKRQDSAYIKTLHLTGRKSKGHGGS